MSFPTDHFTLLSCFLDITVCTFVGDADHALDSLTAAFYYTGSILCSKPPDHRFNARIIDIASAGITIATGRMSSTTSFRAPLAIQIVPAGILTIFVWLLPEVRLLGEILSCHLSSSTVPALVNGHRQDRAR